MRRHGLSKEGLIARQFLLGVVQTADGLPIHHEVFAGNAAETPTRQPTLEKVLARYPHIRRLVVVADRGLLSLDNIDTLNQLRVTGEQPLESILAVAGRRYAELEELLAPLQARGRPRPKERSSTRPCGSRCGWSSPTTPGRRRCKRGCGAAHRHAAGASRSARGQARRAARARGRRLSDSGAKARFFHEVADARLPRIIRVDLASDLFSYDIDPQALRRAELMDGKLLLVTNVEDLTPQEIVGRYKALADIERGFRVLKSEIEIAPVFHRLPERIRAHASLCFMALIPYRVMRQRLRLARSELWPEAALEQLRRIQRHSISIDAGSPFSGISTIDAPQAAVLAALELSKPTLDSPQMSLL